ncbi:hypothetical protein F4806DRAFT_168403 [Annulohypoxylon nitens]|nr:hypothetical protein F4806DRAFT_168403 [Annulohypoxylon nitens]
MYPKNKAVPSAFKCAVDGKWLTPDHFSQTQIAKWFQKKREFYDDVTPDTVGLICRQHTEEGQRQQNKIEIHCTGPCGQWKHRDEFSKNQRNISNPRCKHCTMWAMNMGANETPLIPPKTTMRSQEDMDDASSIQDQITEDRASHTDANFTATGSSAIHSTAAQTTGYQSSRIILDARRDVSNREGLSVIRDVQASKSHSSVRGEGRIKGFPGFSALRDEMMMRRGPAQGLDSAPSNLRRNVNVPEGEVDLYNHDHFTPGNDPFTPSNDPFTPDNDAVEDSASGDTSVPGKIPTAFKRPETGLKGNWAKPDTRRVFYAEPAYPGKDENVDAHDPD